MHAFLVIVTLSSNSPLIPASFSDFRLPRYAIIFLSIWPSFDENLIKDEEIKVVVQINGKVRAEMMIGVEEKEEEVKNKACKNSGILKYLAGKDIKKVIYVKNRLINIVL